jgi:hypothetical protein
MPTDLAWEYLLRRMEDGTPPDCLIDAARVLLGRANMVGYEGVPATARKLLSWLAPVLRRLGIK